MELIKAFLQFKWKFKKTGVAKTNQKKITKILTRTQMILLTNVKIQGEENVWWGEAS